MVDKRSADFAGRHADIAILGAETAGNIAALRDNVLAAARGAHRDEQHLRLFAEIVPFIGPDQAAATPTTRAASYVSGSPTEIVDQIEALANAVRLDGLLVAPRVLRNGLDAFSRDVVPELVRRQRLRSGDGSATLRERLGLARPCNTFEHKAPRQASTAA